MITLSKIAKLAHVSVSTVSKAFAMSEEVNEETREAIFAIAKEHGCFKKYYRAKYPKLVVAVICPEFGSRYYADALSVIQRRLSEYGCEICVAATDFSRENLLELMEYYNKYTTVDAIIIIGGKIPDKKETDIPVGAVFSNPCEGIDVSVNVEFYDAIKQAILHFKDNGRDEIGFVGEPYTERTLDIFRSAMSDCGLQVNPSYISVSDMRFEDGGYDAMQKFFDRGNVPGAVICAYDCLAIGAMKCIHDNGLCVPDHVAVAGKDQIYEAAFMNPPLSSIDTHINKACIIVTDEIINVVNGKTKKYSTTLNAVFNARKSTDIKN